jgi:hypothetical protein
MIYFKLVFFWYHALVAVQILLVQEKENRAFTAKFQKCSQKSFC